ncbi:MAG: hypothetical protein AAB802_03060, partial [Patescibacteria group bacterium]
CSKAHGEGIRNQVENIRREKEKIIETFLSGPHSTPPPNRVQIEQIFDELDGHYAYCPASNPKGPEVVLAEVLVMPATPLSVGAITYFPAAFSGPCALSDAIIHETAHVATGTLHAVDLKNRVIHDWIYDLGASTRKVCEERQMNTSADAEKANP